MFKKGSILTIPSAPQLAVRPPRGGLHQAAPGALIGGGLGVLRAAQTQGDAPHPCSHQVAS